MDGKQAAIVVREYFEGISGICPVVFQTHRITRVDDGYEVMCGVCSAMVHGAKYRGLVGVDGKLAKIERVDGHLALTGVDVVSDSIIIGNLRRINTRQHKQIYDQYDTIGGLRATISELEERDALKTTAIEALEADIRIKDRGITQRGEMIDGLEAELSARKEDSRVLMQVVGALREWQADPLNPRHMIERMRHIVEDYIDVPEIPDRKETGVITDQVIDDALDTIVSGRFNATAGAMQTAIAHQDRRIKYLDAQIDKKSVFISSLLRNDKRFHRLLDDRDKIIESLRVDVANRDSEIHRLRKINRVNGENITDLSDKLNETHLRVDCFVGKRNILRSMLARIGNVIDEYNAAMQELCVVFEKPGVITCVTNNPLIDEITKIIQDDKP